MSIVRATGAALVLGLLAGLACGQDAIGLTPAAQQDLAVWPYRTAELHVRVDSRLASQVTAVRLQWRLGGPTFIYPVTIAPSNPLTLEVVLPAIRVQQVYDVALLTGEANVATQAEATIVWPEDLVNPEAFIDPIAYSRHDGPLPSWPSRVKLGALLSAAAMCAVMASVMFIRRRWVQLAVLGAVVLAAAVAAGTWLNYQPTVAARQGADGKLLILAARRTVKWEAGERLAPIYVDIRQIAHDSMVVKPDGVTLTLEPRQIVLLRRLGRR